MNEGDREFLSDESYGAGNARQRDPKPFPLDALVSGDEETAAVSNTIVERVLSEHRVLWRVDFGTVFVACTGMTCTWGGTRKKTRLEAGIQHEKHVAQMILTALQQTNDGRPISSKEQNASRDAALRKAAQKLLNVFGREVVPQSGFPTGKISWNRKGDNVSAVWVALALDAAKKLQALLLSARPSQGEKP